MSFKLFTKPHLQWWIQFCQHQRLFMVKSGDSTWKSFHIKLEEKKNTNLCAEALSGVRSVRSTLLRTRGPSSKISKGPTLWIKTSKDGTKETESTGHRRWSNREVITAPRCWDRILCSWHSWRNHEKTTKTASKCCIFQIQIVSELERGYHDFHDFQY